MMMDQHVFMISLNTGSQDKQGSYASWLGITVSSHILVHRILTHALFAMYI